MSSGSQSPRSLGFSRLVGSSRGRSFSPLLSAVSTSESRQSRFHFGIATSSGLSSLRLLGFLGPVGGGRGRSSSSPPFAVSISKILFRFGIVVGIVVGKSAPTPRSAYPALTPVLCLSPSFLVARVLSPARRSRLTGAPYPSLSRPLLLLTPTVDGCTSPYGLSKVPKKWFWSCTQGPHHTKTCVA